MHPDSAALRGFHQRRRGAGAIAGAGADDLRGAWRGDHRRQDARATARPGTGRVRLRSRAGKDGVTLWRFELAAAGSSGQHPAGPGVRSQEKLSAALETIPQGELLLRGDSVAFPPGGCAFLHKHWGPGIRCLLDGGIRIDTHGRSTSYGPGSAWYETGSDPVFAQAAMDRPSRFIRVMVLPRSLLGKSSFQFVNEEDKAKPRVQQYKIFTDMPIATPKG